MCINKLLEPWFDMLQLTLSQTTDFKLFQTILNLKKIAESSPNGKKTLWVKEKLLVMGNFSFSHSVFKRLVSQGCQKVSLCGYELNRNVKFNY